MSATAAVKTFIKQRLVWREHRKYNYLLQKMTNNYNEWISDKESRIHIENEGNLSFHFLDFSNCGCGLPEMIADISEDIIVFHEIDGVVSRLAKPLISELMTRRPELLLVYGDEDWFVEKGKEKGLYATAKRPPVKLPDLKLLQSKTVNRIRINPWFKPDWSPDTFLDGFYLGSIFAVRREAALAALRDMEREGRLLPAAAANLCELCYRLAMSGGGFTKRPPGTAPVFPVGHITEVLFHGESYNKKTSVIYKGDFPDACGDYAGQLITVVIPSKDHPDILKRCLQSFVSLTRYRCYQLIIVDNGSTPENKEAVENYLRQLEQEGPLAYPPVYHYRDMPFNFSAMCNIGAGLAHPDTQLLLFLNDDMEICQPDWLERMAAKAVLPRVGAVGAKLLYPDSDIIQHAGITNLRPGPAHKLQFLSDSREHYFGKNRGVHNMLAVTGACLMVRKAVFTENGGFAEELAVAFNDVDLNYTIWEAGYVNMVLNDVILYHHESLSRGKDGESDEKRLRLMREHDILYHRHRSLYARDPYYHKYLLSDMLMPEYVPALNFEVDLGVPWAAVTAFPEDIAGVPEDACVRIGIESITDIYEWKYGIKKQKSERNEKEDEGYYMQGYSFVIGGDNACYERTLLMKDPEQGTIWKIPIITKYRADIKAELKDQLNVDLTGFTAKISREMFPAGEFALGMMVKDRCSRQKLINWAEGVWKV